MPKFTIGLLLAGWAVSGSTAAAQVARQPAAPTPSFDVVSIKPHEGLPIPGNTSTGHGTWIPGTTNLSRLVQLAYDVPPVRIAGIPSTFIGSSAGFDISAKFPPETSPADFRRMVQSMLASRFHLVAHFESRELNVAALEVAPGGLKLRPANGECRSDFDPGPLANDPDCGVFGAIRRTVAGSGPIYDYEGKAVTIADLAAVLATPSQMVIDETGLTGRYDISLTIPLMVTVPSVTPGKTVVRLRESFDDIGLAVRQQLGLNGRSVKRPVQVLVADRVEMPTPN